MSQPESQSRSERGLISRLRDPLKTQGHPILDEIVRIINQLHLEAANRIELLEQQLSSVAATSKGTGISFCPACDKEWAASSPSEIGATDRHRIEVEEVLGAAFADALQEDFDGIRELVRAVKITFPDGSPVVTIQALRDAYRAMAEARGIK